MKCTTSIWTLGIVMGLVILAGSASASSEQVGVWNIVHQVDELLDTPMVHITAQSDKKYDDAQGRTEHALLTIGCTRGKTVAFVQFAGAYMGTKTVDVTYRIDKTDASRQQFRAERTFAYLNDPHETSLFVLYLTLGKQLLFRAHPRLGPAVTVRFDLAGIGDAIKPIRNLCP